jgi:fumarate hydratase class II
VAINIGGQHGNFELNTMMPMIAHHLLQSVRLLANGAHNLADRCVKGIEADKERAESLVGGSLALAAALVPYIGYDAAAKISQEAFAAGKTVFEVALAHKVLPEDRLRRVLDPMRETEAGIPRPEDL